jgi:hypothetical protein
MPERTAANASHFDLVILGAPRACLTSLYLRRHYPTLVVPSKHPLVEQRTLGNRLG